MLVGHSASYGGGGESGRLALNNGGRLAPKAGGLKVETTATATIVNERLALKLVEGWR